MIALCFLFARVFYIAYSVHTKAKQLHTEINRLKSDPPLRVRKVSQGTDYYEGDVMVILEPHNSISTGDVLTLFVREGDMEIPICLLSVEAITNKDFLQSVVFHALTERPLLGYLTDQNRLEQLQAKRNISRSYLEGGN